MIIDGKKIAQEIRDDLKNSIVKLKRAPALAVILIGNNPASLIYVNKKERACKETGITSILIKMDKDIEERVVIEEVKRLNLDHQIDGILIQFPLPPHLSEERVVSTIDPNKDVDGFHPLNFGKLFLGWREHFSPCTPLGIKTLLEKYSIQVSGKHVVIVGRSNIVGKPLAALLVRKGSDATVTIAHSYSRNLSAITREADILVAAVGKAKFITKEMVKSGAVVIDVGINRENGKIVGDVDFENVSSIASYITPVPGGVGPMTIAMLLKNVVMAYTKNNDES